MKKTIRSVLAGATLALGLTATGAMAEGNYGPGVTDTEIKIGTIAPFSGPASVYGAVIKAMSGYFDKINAEKGGINGRKITLISLDDGYNPAKSIEHARRLVEREKVLFLASTVGTAPNAAIQKYLNQREVPHLLVGSGASRWNMPEEYPWTTAWIPSYENEGNIYGQHILANAPGAKIAVLYQNDDYGKDYLRGFEAALGNQADSMIVAAESYEATDPTVDSQMVTLKSSGADTIMYFTAAKQAAQAIRKAGELGWHPQQYVSTNSISIESVITPAGPENAMDMYSTAYTQDPTDPQWMATPEYAEWLEFMETYNAGASIKDTFGVYGYSVGRVIEDMLTRAGDDLTRENIMNVALSVDMELPTLIKGVRVNPTPGNHNSVNSVELIRFNGTDWSHTGEVYSAQMGE